MPPFSKRIAIGFTCLSVSVTSAFFVKTINAQVPPSGTFTAMQACPATQAINGNNPGNVQLTRGTSYTAIGFNSPQRQFVLVAVRGATPERRWVRATCGEFQALDGSPVTPTPLPSASPTPEPTNPSNSSLLPFFDTKTNPVAVDFPRGEQKDISPRPPQLNVFDRKILELCGAGFDAPVSDVKFRQLMTFYPDVVRKLKQATGGELKPNRNSDSQFLDDLTAIW
ncbi:hypothetical protein JOY44_18635 [Phormidium sp. CLA17]|uniref:hypothetical protein n=1 Tax=Leptolyngbya sp. Cla-17 TaxID=2803751 RepID=UPI001492BCA5|nr:hypothetical protein [Leptolyngbya sp. Cla-17]MBM0743606.1 hypothetical protein [Leptolyngbya sp. Cla-17]